MLINAVEAKANMGSGKARPDSKGSRNKLINRQVTRAADSGNISSLFKVIQTHIAEMNGINLATSFHRIAKLAAGDPAVKLHEVKRHECFISLFEKISDHVSGHSATTGPGAKDLEGKGQMPVQCLSIVAWSCATLRVRNAILFANIAAIVVPCLEELKPYELSNLLWAYTKLDMLDSELCACLTERLLKRRDGEFKVQCLSTIAWCFATAQIRSVPVFASIAEEVIAHASEAKPQQISTTLWAFAKCRYYSADLFEVLADVALSNSNLSTFKIQELSNTAWAFATAGLHNIKLFTQLEHVVLSHISRIEPQSVANILWAFAKLQVPLQTDLFTRLLNLTMSKQRQFKPEELSAVIWAASQMFPGFASFFDTAMNTCVKRLADFSINGIANLVKTLSAVDTSDPQLFIVILQQSLKFLAQSHATALCSVLHGSAIAIKRQLYAIHKEVISDGLNQVCVEITSRIAEFKHRDIKLLSTLLDDPRIALATSSSIVLQQVLANHAARTMTVTADSELESQGHESGEEEGLAWSPDEGSKCTQQDSNSSHPSRKSSPATSPGSGPTSSPAMEKQPEALPANANSEPCSLNLALLSAFVSDPGWQELFASNAGVKSQMPYGVPWKVPTGPKDDVPWKVPLPSFCHPSMPLSIQADSALFSPMNTGVPCL